MNRPILIFGAGHFSDIVTYILEEKLQAEIAAYVLNRDYITEDRYQGKPVIALEDVEKAYKPTDFDFVMGFIGKKMMQDKARTFSEIIQKGYHLPNIIDPTASVDTRQIGQGNIILAHATVEHHCQIGDGNIIWQNAAFPHHNIIGNFNNISPSVSFSGYSSIGNHCFIGNNAVLKNKVYVDDFAFIGAGAYVSKNVLKSQVIVPQRSVILENKTGLDFL